MSQVTSTELEREMASKVGECPRFGWTAMMELGQQARRRMRTEECPSVERLPIHLVRRAVHASTVHASRFRRRCPFHPYPVRFPFSLHSERDSVVANRSICRHPDGQEHQWIYAISGEWMCGCTRGIETGRVANGIGT
jgi:hypothetical protein